MIAYTLKKDDDGKWSIRCMGAVLANGLLLESALRQAHAMAHTKRMHSGLPICVEVVSAAAYIRAADEAQPKPRWRSVTA